MVPCQDTVKYFVLRATISDLQMRCFVAASRIFHFAHMQKPTEQQILFSYQPLMNCYSNFIPANATRIYIHLSEFGSTNPDPVHSGREFNSSAQCESLETNSQILMVFSFTALHEVTIRVCFVLTKFDFISSSHMALHHYHHWAFPTGALYLCSAASDMTGYPESGTGKLSPLS